MGCLLGIDYGSKRIGLAVSDAARRMALPLSAIDAANDHAKNAAAVLKVAAEYDVDELVLGLPLNMDDSEGPQAKIIRAFGEVLSRAAAKPIHFQDERLSSATADELLQPAELTNRKHKSRRDGVAAQVILQQYLDECSARGA